MVQIFVNANFDFVGKRRWFYVASVAAMAISVLSILLHGGLNYGIDFTGGTLVQVRYDKPVTVADVRRGLDDIKLGTAVIQQFGDAQEYLIRLPQEKDVKAGTIADEIKAALGKAAGTTVENRRVEFVGPQVGRDLQLQALYAVLAGMAGILIYVAIRFDYRGGMISIAAIAHDVIVTLGALSIANREMSLPVLAALLTIVGYSINDTIVVFDRIRENLRLYRDQEFERVVNASVNQTLSRTILTVFTVFIAVMALYLYGGEKLNPMSFCLLVGTIFGSYSSVFVAAALLVLAYRWRPARVRT